MFVSHFPDYFLWEVKFKCCKLDSMAPDLDSLIGNSCWICQNKGAIVFPLHKVHFTKEKINNLSHSYENSWKTLYIVLIEKGVVVRRVKKKRKSSHISCHKLMYRCFMQKKKNNIYFAHIICTN